jgi:uncharacterized Ntn-hydrolase superfamily protein
VSLPVDTRRPDPPRRLDSLDDLAPADLAERYYRLVHKATHALAAGTMVPWDKLPAKHRAVFVAAAAALLRGER